jgi:hypothetical protein
MATAKEGEVSKRMQPYGNASSCACAFTHRNCVYACSSASAATFSPLPDGWFVAGSANVPGASPDNYTAGVQQDVRYHGRSSAFIESKPSATSRSFGTFVQMFSAKKYLGKRVELRAAVRTQDSQSAGLWMGVDDSVRSVRFDNMQNRHITGTTPWKTYDVVLDVPQNAVDIGFGLLESGTGKAWLNDVSFRLPSAPRNLSF